MGVGWIGQECLLEQVGLVKNLCRSGWNCSRVSAGVGKIVDLNSPACFTSENIGCLQQRLKTYLFAKEHLLN